MAKPEFCNTAAATAEILRQPGQPSQRAQAGFTLAELLAALGILLFGVTALLGALASAAAQRRTADARHEATALCEEIVHRLQHEALRLRADADSPLDLELVTLEQQVAPGFPGMRWSATTVVAEDRPDVLLLRIQVRWLEEGEDVAEEFFRIVPRQLPLGQRVRQHREQTASR